MDAVEILVRWLHVIAGITWIGFLYFFNFVNIPLQAALDDATKPKVNPQLMPRVLWWFRWGAMVTFLAGLYLYWSVYIHQELLTDGTGGLSGRSWWIHMGMLFGIIMWFNVWFIIWPAQKKLLGGTAGDQAAELRKRATLASRVNTFSSGPMLFGMLGASHYSAFGAMWVVAILLGLAAIWWAYQISGQVGKSVN